MWGKILAGVAVGVGAVAAAPFTGGGSLLGGASLIASLTGAGTIAAAVGAGAVGGIVGATVAENDEKEKKTIATNAKNEGKALGKAENEKKISSMVDQLSQALEQLQGTDAHFRAIIAMEAVGASCASCDGELSEEEKQDIGEFVKGMIAQNIPNNVKEKLKNIYDNPPTINEAFILAKDSGIPIDVYDDLINFVINVDGIVKKEEEVFVQAWNQLKVA